LKRKGFSRDLQTSSRALLVDAPAAGNVVALAVSISNGSEVQRSRK
jgi:hypothetical protein